MAIVCILATPFVMLGGVVMARLAYRKAPGGKSTDDPNTKRIDPYEESNALLSEVIMNYRTVISFGQGNVNKIMDKYEDLLSGPADKRIRNAHIAGIAFGYSICIKRRSQLAAHLYFPITSSLYLEQLMAYQSLTTDKM